MRKVALAACVLTVTVMTGVSFAQNPAAEIKKLDDQRMQAISDADMTAVAALLADDYVHVHSSGLVQNKAEYIANLSKSPRKSYRAPNAKVSTRVYGDIAVMVGSQFNKTGEREQEYTVTLIWRKVAGGWKQVGAAYSPIPAPKP